MEPPRPSSITLGSDARTGGPPLWTPLSHLAAVIESSDDAIITQDLDGQITSWNRGAQRIFGYTADEVLGRSVTILMPPDRVDEEFDILARIRRGEKIDRHETVRLAKDGGLVDISLTVSPLRDEQGRIIGVSKVARDITSRTQWERTKLLLATIVESSDDAIVTKDLNGRITSWNGGAQRIFGWSAAEAIGRSIFTLIPEDRHAEERDIMARLQRGERVEHIETVRLTKSGAVLDISLTISPLIDARGRIIGASKVARDITERKRTERLLVRHRDHLNELVEQRTAELASSQEQLRMSERMAAMGTLAAGLGHDMGNLLLPVRTRLDVLEAVVPPEALDEVQSIRETAKYLGQLASGLRLLARHPEDAALLAEATDLREWWAEVGLLLRNPLPPAGELRWAISDDMPLVRIGKSALTQAVFNLVQNAGDAMRIAGRETGMVEVRAELSPDGKSVRIGVTDDGPGMTEEVRARCFEPFYSTKPRGISTGLGLSFVQGIAQQAGGAAAVRSALGRGTSVELELPAQRRSMNGEGATARPLAAVSLGEPRIRSFVRSLLGSLGFDVAEERAPNRRAVLWITEAAADPASLAAFLTTDARRRVLLYGPAPATDPDPRILTAPAPFHPTMLRDLLVTAARAAAPNR